MLASDERLRCTSTVVILTTVATMLTKARRFAVEIF